ncbi:Scr1 family TA system antitoxin-like transcriptional regulator [Streptomyces sp. NPDC048389]|uniref:DUF397 domain-containing protein n=1 Tax=Streptomyces sp. NPDC048389 TaxID=3154622 RepID=UPI0034532B49
METGDGPFFVAVDGDLTTNGLCELWTREYTPGVVVVTGDLSASVLSFGNNSRVFVEGDVRVTGSAWDSWETTTPCSTSRGALRARNALGRLHQRSRGRRHPRDHLRGRKRVGTPAPRHRQRRSGRRLPPLAPGTGPPHRDRPGCPFPQRSGPRTPGRNCPCPAWKSVSPPVSCRAATPVDLRPVDGSRSSAMTRVNRQARLSQPKPLRCWFILDEAALRRAVGGPAVMDRRLASLIECGTRSHVTIQVLPFAVGGLEVAEGFPGNVPVRDSENPHGPALVFPAGSWSAFISSVRTTGA